MITVEYKNAELVYNENDNLWICRDYDLEKDSLAKLKKAVSEKMSKEMKQKNITVFFKRGWGTDFSKAVITSFSEDGKQAWLKNADNRRFKGPVNYLYEFSDENRAKIKSIKDFEKEKTAIDKKIEKVAREVTKFKTEG